MLVRRALVTASLRGLLCGSLIALAAACSSNNPGGDANTGDARGDTVGIDGNGGDSGGLDANGGDANNSDGTNIDAPPSDVPVSDGPIQVRDGVTIMEDGGSRVCFPIQCAGHLLECGDCMDNDGDGVVDSRDPECLGPCDNTEGATLLTGVGGETGGPCQSDCYFDFGNGPGNDDCHWDHRCDPLAVAPNYPPEGDRCQYDPSRLGSSDCPNNQSMACRDFCQPLTPNGCDCFGCCTFPGLEGRGPGGTPGYVWLGSRDADGNGTCTLGQITNPAACQPCTPVGNCFNECGRCEVCIGRPIPPADCFMTPVDAGPGPDGAPVDVPSPPDGTSTPDSSTTPDGGTSMQCPTGVVPCGLPGQPECAFGSYCITGCCRMAPG